MNRHRLKTHVASSKPTGNAGATLTEILMALMIMGIGVTSVATLFPYAIMRSVRATQLTNAALLRYQVDEIVDLAPTVMPFNMPLNNPDTAAIGAGPAMFSGFPLGPSSVRVHIIDPLGFYKTSGAGRQWNTFNVRSSGNFSQAAAQDFCVLNDSWVTEWSGTVESINAGRTQITFPETAVPTLQTLREILVSRVGAGAVANPERPGLRVRVICTSSDGKVMQSRNLVNPANVDDSAAGRSVTFSSALPNNGNFDTLQDVFIQVFETRYSWMITATTRLIAPGDDGVPGVPIWRDNTTGTTYGVDEWVRSTDSSINQKFLRCVQGGTPGGSEPGWDNNTPNGTEINDGGVIWVVSDQPDSGDTVTTEMDLVVFFRRDFTSVAERTLPTLGRTEFVELNEDDAADEIVIDYAGFTDPKPTFVENQWVFVTSQRNGRFSRGEWAQIRRVLEDNEAVNQVQLQLDRRVWSNRDPRNATLTVFIPDGVLDVYPLGIIGSDE